MGMLLRTFNTRDDPRIKYVNAYIKRKFELKYTTVHFFVLACDTCFTITLSTEWTICLDLLKIKHILNPTAD